MRRFPAGDFNILARNVFEISAKKSKKIAIFRYPWHTEKVGQMAPIFSLLVYTGHQHDPIGYGLGLMVTKRAHQVDDGWMDGRTDAIRTIFTNSAFSRAKNEKNKG
jgi:hypothetical protein